MQLSWLGIISAPIPFPLGSSSDYGGLANASEKLSEDWTEGRSSFNPTHQSVGSRPSETGFHSAGLGGHEPGTVQVGLSGLEYESQQEWPSGSERPANRHVFRYHFPPQAPKLNRRELALQWVARNSNDFAGQWVVLDGDRLLAHGTAAREVAQAARVHGVGTPAIIRIPEGEELPFAGW